MFVDKLVKIYFSPTYSTEKIVQTIAKRMGIVEQKTINLNSLGQRHNIKFNIQPTEAVILGTPVYEERIPDLLYPVLRKIHGQGQLMILVVTYGNISAGIALKQLNKMMTYQGFKVIAAASFIGEHSFSQEDIKIAPGRPDNRDLEIAESLGKEIQQKIKSIKSIKNIPDLNIKGELLPLGKLLPKHSEIVFAHAPVVDLKVCQNCRKCIEICPVNAIETDSLRSRDKLCIRCFACVKFCPYGARKIIYKKPVFVKTVLKRLGRKRKEPEFFI